MEEDTNEDNKPHLCVPTLDGNAHVIPAEVFDKIVSGEMKSPTWRIGKLSLGQPFRNGCED